ncbi:MAG: hypothetical protein GY696_16445 [Gammaproteobacteria bacterium]|nr:hypothetical protein [Gammaproteobacteria bacterium]
MSQIEQPKTLREALSSEHSKEWKDSAYSEYSSLIENNTWELVELPKARKPIACRWIFRVKYLQDGSVDRFKSRLVAKG